MGPLFLSWKMNMITVDPIFEQNYRKKVDLLCTHTFEQGRQIGRFEVSKFIFATVQQLSENGTKLIHPEALLRLLAHANQKDNEEQQDKEPIFDTQESASENKPKVKLEIVK